MKFRFHLESALRLALRSEEMARTELGRCIAILDGIRQEIATLRQQLRDETALQNAAREGVIWAQGQTLFFDWVRGQAMRIAEWESAFLQAQTDVERAREILVEKRRSVEVMKRLKERRYAQWRLEQSRKELAEGSDIAARRWTRDHASG